MLEIIDQKLAEEQRGKRNICISEETETDQWHIREEREES